jgi:hypothetical protein
MAISSRDVRFTPNRGHRRIHADIRLLIYESTP